jgi:hypothetical protein
LDLDSLPLFHIFHYRYETDDKIFFDSGGAVGLAQHPPPPQQQQQQQHVLLPQAVVLQFPCPVCQVVFPAQDLLEAHAKTHSQRNKCPVCALTFPKAPPKQMYILPGLRIHIHLIRIWIRIQHFRLNTDPGSGSGVLMTKN